MSIAITIGGICEQDLDLFFLEEVAANSSFRAWLLSKLLPLWPAKFDDLVSARRSIKYADGEVDLQFTFQDSSRDRACVIMENKINAGFQLGQLDRYQGRASDLRRSGEFKHVAVALIAPEAYKARSSDKVKAIITYEEVEGWLTAQEPDARTHYKSSLIHTAIAKQKTGYNFETDQPVTDFWLAYWQEADSRAPELGMMPPERKPAGAAFVRFRCSDLPDSLNIWHKLTKGFVDLQFRRLGGQVAQLKAALAPMIEPGMEVTTATGSAAVRIKVTELNTVRPFVEQTAGVHEGIRAATTLLDWARRNSARLSEIERSLP